MGTNKFIYVFGGMDNYNNVSQIERHQLEKGPDFELVNI